MFEKNVRFYSFIALAIIILIGGVVGTANFIFGYMMNDSPCTSCWALRINMIVVCTAALLMLRYGLKAKYVGFIMVVAAFGIWNAFWHLGVYAQLDMGQGQALMVFNLHTQLWAGVVYFGIVLLLGLILMCVAPDRQSVAAEFKDKAFRALGKIEKIAFWVFFVVISSNVFQAFFSAGPPPFTAADNPQRFTMVPKYLPWQSAFPNLFADPSWRGPFGIVNPDLPSSPSEAIKFDNNSDNSPLAINQKLSIESQKEINLDVEGGINGIRFDKANNRFAVVTEANDMYLVNKDFSNINDNLKIEINYFPSLLHLTGVEFTPDGAIQMMSYNKTYLTVKEDKNADDVASFTHLLEGYDRFTVLNRNLFRTVRANTSYIAAFTRDSKYSYYITVPDNLKQEFVLVKQLNADEMLSAEVTPGVASSVTLKDDRNIGELYTTAMTMKNGYIYAASKNFNTIVVIDPKEDMIINTISFPNEITNLRGMDFVGDKIYMVSYQDGKNKLFILK